MCVMQAKRVDIETFGTWDHSMKYTEWQEDEELNKLPEFDRGLVGLQKQNGCSMNERSQGGAYGPV
jgi:hypothetical protein